MYGPAPTRAGFAWPKFKIFACARAMRGAFAGVMSRPAMALGAPDSDPRQGEAEYESGDAAWLEGPGSKCFKTSAISTGLKP